MSALLNQIDELLEQYDEYSEQAFETQEQAEQAKPKFEVTDKSSAEWVVRKIAKIKGESEEIIRIAHEQIEPLQAEIDTISEWEIKELARRNRHTEFLVSLLEPYHRMILEADPKAKTIKLPHGDLKIRAQQPEIKRDDDLLIRWLKADEGTKKFVEVKEAPKWGELKKLCKIENGAAIYLETGEQVAGIMAIDKPDKFEVTVK